MLKNKWHKYPIFLHIVKILLVCLVSTSQVERQFSAIKRMIGDWHLSLDTFTLECLLRITTEGPSIEEFDPEPAVRRWLGKCVRRPHTKLYGRRKGKKINVDDSDLALADSETDSSDIYSEPDSHSDDGVRESEDCHDCWLLPPTDQNAEPEVPIVDSD
jgi:hypothetical protein